MTKVQQKSPGWLTDFIQLVRHRLRQLYSQQQQQGPVWKQELRDVEEGIKRLFDLIESGKLDDAASETADVRLNEAHARKRHLESQLQQLQCYEERLARQVQPQHVLRQLNRLSEALRRNDPTRANLELSMFYERIVGCSDGTVVLRTCKLGVLPEVVDQLAVLKDTDSSATKPKGRRRGKLRVTSNERPKELKAQAHFIANPQRFASLDDSWFWTDRISIPKEVSWPVAHAEAVFRRRQESRWPYSQLALEFDVSAPTIGAAIRAYLATHPSERDNVQLKRGGKRRPKFDLSVFADEAKGLWLGGKSKQELAIKYGCSEPTVTKAIAFAYTRAGQVMPTSTELRLQKVTAVRELFNSDKTLKAIAKELGISSASAREFLRQSFEREGKPLPDLRRLRKVRRKRSSST